MIFALIGIASSLHKPVGIPIEYFTTESFKAERDNRDPKKVLVVFQTNSQEKNEILMDFFYDGAELAASFVKDSLFFGIIFDENIKVPKTICYYHGQQGSFRISKDLIPAQVATKILHLNSRLMKAAKRKLKEIKKPEVAKLKNEVRQIMKEIKRNESNYELQEQLDEKLSMLIKYYPDGKQNIKIEKYKAKQIQNFEERQLKRVEIKKLKTKLINKSKNEDHKWEKKQIDQFRRSWHESKEEEKEYDNEKVIKEMIEHHENSKKMNEEAEKEEMEEMMKMMKEAKDLDEDKEL